MVHGRFFYIAFGLELWSFIFNGLSRQKYADQEAFENDHTETTPDKLNLTFLFLVVEKGHR